jgi:hypothetical protein
MKSHERMKKEGRRKGTINNKEREVSEPFEITAVVVVVSAHT